MIALISAFSLLTYSEGVPFGAKKPNHGMKVVSSVRNPDSAKVGTLGTSADRLLPGNNMPLTSPSTT